MFLRKIRWLSAALLAAVALVASPGQSQAAVEVLIQEIGPGGTTTLFSNTVLANGQVSVSSGSFTAINLQFANAASNLASSFSTSYTITPSTSLNVANAPQLSIKVQDTGAAGTGITGVLGANATLTNNVSATSGILTSDGLGTQTLADITSVVDFADNSAIGTSPTNSAVSPGSASSSTGVSNLSAKYSLIQSFTINLNGTGTAEATTLTGGVSSTLQISQAVPAPPAALLAALALPIFGMRRVLRRKAA